MSINPVVHFIHGKESGPAGRKIVAMATVAQRLGFVTESLDYASTMDPSVRLDMLLAACAPLQSPPVLVGSSMGGWVAAEAASRRDVAGAFLLAPALYMPGYPSQHPDVRVAHLEIVHGWSDDVIPAEHSIRFAQKQRCGLHLIEAGHRLNEQIPLLCELFGLFLRRLQRSVDC